ncbi:MAG: alpha/beta fold hydrolase [Chloroflexi bacterium]|nr:alpha/beta fold hydrolase [Chloroflexota bacterium]
MACQSPDIFVVPPAAKALRYGHGLRKDDIHSSGLAAGGYAGVSAAMAWGLTRTVRVRPSETPESVGLKYSDISFTIRGGDAALSGWLIPPEAHSDSPQATAHNSSWIVMVHGDNSNRGDSKTGMLGIANALSERGFGVFMFDMRGRGDSPGTVTSSGYYERLDLQGAADYLVSKGADRGRIGVLGFSLGGVAALIAGSSPNNFGAVVSDSAFADLSIVVKSSMTGVRRLLAVWLPGMRFMAKALYGIDMTDVSPARAIAKSDTPMFVIHGEEDGVVPVEHARLLGRALGASFSEIESGEETVWIVPGAGHTGSFRTQPTRYIDTVARFFDNHLGKPGIQRGEGHRTGASPNGAGVKPIQLPENSNN